VQLVDAAHAAGEGSDAAGLILVCTCIGAGVKWCFGALRTPLWCSWVNFCVLAELALCMVLRRGSSAVTFQQV
jgi:hypothetical protein